MQPTRDVFAALGEDLGAGRWSVRAQVRPLINYVWFASVLMALGGIIAASDRRYRTAREGAGQRSNHAATPPDALPAAGAARVATGEA
jgi:cytochrome c-type biogenesis protein CcmF